MWVLAPCFVSIPRGAFQDVTTRSTTRYQKPAQPTRTAHEFARTDYSGMERAKWNAPFRNRLYAQSQYLWLSVSEFKGTRLAAENSRHQSRYAARIGSGGRLEGNAAAGRLGAGCGVRFGRFRVLGC